MDYLRPPGQESGEHRTLLPGQGHSAAGGYVGQGVVGQAVYGLGAVFGKQGDDAALRPGGLAAAGGLRPGGAVQRRKGVGNGADALVIGNGCDLACPADINAANSRGRGCGVVLRRSSIGRGWQSGPHKQTEDRETQNQRHAGHDRADGPPAGSDSFFTAAEHLRLTFLQGPHSSSIPSSPKMLCSSRLARYSRLSTCLLFLPMTRAASA